MGSLWLKIQGYWNNYTGVFSIIVGVGSFLVTSALSEILGGAFQNWYSNVALPWLQRSSNQPNWVFVLTALIVAFFGFLFGMVIDNYRTSKKVPYTISTLNTSNIYYFKERSYRSLLEDVDNLLRQSLSKGKGLQSLEWFIKQLYLILPKYVGEQVLTGGGILLPDQNNPDELFFWSQTPSTKSSFKRFYIGNDPSRLHDRGVAGNVYLDGKSRKVTIKDKQNGRADDPSFHFFCDAEHNSFLRYDAFVCARVEWLGQPVGVLTLDFRNPDMFHTEDLEWIKKFADRVGDALVLHGEVEQIENVPHT
ncbi:GAF domain-containing protein [candidate division WWE3 bacterium]|uniref:GAF domain-containing protein n=1 Tax=candidate division WWE3 bacterium TaxID=2053526 RepID=A0A955LW76_UNCKA|nr:GAF domain-containing protein [candidate division WWE3 bacterium]